MNDLKRKLAAYQKHQPSVEQALIKDHKKNLFEKNPVLYSASLPVGSDHQPNLADLVTLMTKVMRHHEGIGIAAPQIGINLSLSSKQADTETKTTHVGHLESVPKEIFVNPIIVKAPRNLILLAWLSECQRIAMGLVATYDWIEYRAFDQYFNQKNGLLSGLAAIIFQHEFRHLLGGLYLDHALEFMTKKDLDCHLTASNVSALTHQIEKPSSHLLEDYTVGSPIYPT